MDGDLVVLDSSTFKETGKIVFGMGANPTEVVPSHDQKLLYVSNRGYDEIAVIDVNTEKVTARIKTALHPNFSRITPDGRYLVVANNQANEATVIDLRTNIVAGSPAIGRGASGVAITDDGRYAYVTSIYDEYVSVIDLEKMERVSTIPAPGAIGIVKAEGSPFAYFGTHRDRISVLDTRTNEIVGSVPAGDTPNYITLSPDGSLAFVTNALSNDISVIDTRNRTLLKNIPVGIEPSYSALSPDGKRLFVNNYSDGKTDGSISVIDVQSLKEISRVNFWRNPRALAVLPAR